MIVCDTSALLAQVNAADPSHEVVRAAVDAEPGPFLVSPFVLAELDYMVADRVGTDAELSLLADVVAGAYRLEPFDAGDVARAGEVISQYRDLGLGLADASVVVLAERHRTTRILTFDERHFRAVAPLQGGAFELLPSP